MVKKNSRFELVTAIQVFNKLWLYKDLKLWLQSLVVFFYLTKATYTFRLFNPFVVCVRCLLTVKFGLHNLLLLQKIVLTFFELLLSK